MTREEIAAFADRQPVMVYASAAARDAALAASGVEGAITYQFDTNTFTDLAAGDGE